MCLLFRNIGLEGNLFLENTEVIKSSIEWRYNSTKLLQLRLDVRISEIIRKYYKVFLKFCQ